MFRWLQPSPSYEQLIEVITAKNVLEAQNLIARMYTIELSKVTNDGNTALTLAARDGLEKVCELLIPNVTTGY